MTSVTIVPIQNPKGDVTYSAVAGENQSFGNTAGEALDALTSQLDMEDSTLVIVQHRRPDAFFGRDQQRRLTLLMERWRDAREDGKELSLAEQNELDQLVLAELRAATARAAAISDEAEQ